MSAGYIFGGNTGETPQSLARNRAIAQALMQANSGTPKNVGEGLSAIGNALAYRFAMNRANKAEAAGQDSTRGPMAGLTAALDGPGSFPAAPPPPGGSAPSASGGAPYGAVERGGELPPATGQFGEVAPRLIGDLSKDFGLSPEQAAGVVGQLGHESGGFSHMQEINPTVPGSRGGYGYAQWTGPRRKAFEQFASGNGLDPNSYEANYGFLKNELQNSPEGKVLDSVKAATDARSAGRAFTDGFLRPGIPGYASRDRWTDRALALAGQPAQSGPAGALDAVAANPAGQQVASLDNGTVPYSGPGARIQTDEEQRASPDWYGSPQPSPAKPVLPPGTVPWSGPAEMQTPEQERAGSDIWRGPIPSQSSPGVSPVVQALASRNVGPQPQAQGMPVGSIGIGDQTTQQHLLAPPVDPQRMVAQALAASPSSAGAPQPGAGGGTANPVAQALLGKSPAAPPPEMAGGAGALIDTVNGPSLSQIMEVARNPWLSEQDRGLVSSLYEQKMQERDPLRQLQLQKARRDVAAPQKNWQKLDDNTLFDPESGETKAIGGQDEGDLFEGKSPEAQGLNYLVRASKLTRDQAAELAAGKTVTGPNGEVMFMTPGAIFPQVAPAGAVPGAQPATAPAGPASPGRAGMIPVTDPKKASDPERNAMTFADRMTDSGQLLDTLENVGLNKKDQFVSGNDWIPDSLENWGVSGDFQKFDQARRDFVNAQLRRESGAVISPQEFENANKQYFPIPGDTAEVVAQKRRNRQTVIDGMVRSAGPTYQPKAKRPEERPEGGIPEEAVHMLQDDPSLSDQFDAKFGKGASRHFLEGQ